MSSTSGSDAEPRLRLVVVTHGFLAVAMSNERDGERLSREVMDNIAASLIGKSILCADPSVPAADLVIERTWIEEG